MNIRRTTILQALASELQRERHFQNNPQLHRVDNVREMLASLKDCLPSGSGIDSGTTIEIADCLENLIVLSCSYHHMNYVGYYVGWTDHTIRVSPTFDGFDLRITGKDRNDIRDYLGEVYYHALQQTIEIDGSDVRVIYEWENLSFDPIFLGC